MSLIKRLSNLANSEKGKELQAKAKKIANDPETREKIDAARRRISDKVGGGSKSAGGGPAAGGEAKPTDAEPPDSSGGATGGGTGGATGGGDKAA